MRTIEQRGATRFEVEVAAEVYTPKAVLPARTRDMSSTGVCLDLDQGLEEGITVGVSLFFTTDGIEDPDAEPLNVKAKVMWCTEREDTGFSAGTRFEDVTDHSAELLGNFLSALSA
jgi:hypothetical protein